MPDYQIFWIIRWYLYWPQFLQVTFQYCCYTWSLKPIREVFHFGISICWFRVTRSSSVLSGPLIAAEVNGIGDQKPGDTTTVDVQTFLEASEHTVEIYLSRIFSGKKDWGICADSLLEVLDYQKCHNIRCQVKRILLYNGARLKNKCDDLMQQYFINNAMKHNRM